METKISKLRALMATGDYRAALRLAASFGRLGEHKEQITRGWAAMTRASFYRQIGKDPEVLVEAGIKAIEERYGIIRGKAS